MELECNSIGPSTFSTFPSGPTFVLSSFHSSFHSSSHFVQATSLFSTLRVEVNSEQVGAGAGAHSESERRKQLLFNKLKQIHKTCLNMFELRHLPGTRRGSSGFRGTPKTPPPYLSACAPNVSIFNVHTMKRESAQFGGSMWKPTNGFYVDPDLGFSDF